MGRVESADTFRCAFPTELPGKLVHALDLAETALVEAYRHGSELKAYTSFHRANSPKLVDEKVNNPEHSKSWRL